MELLATLATAYMIGSIPFGLLLTKMAGLGDIRTIGSGNIGATNVMRTGHKWLGIATLLLDGGKGFLAAYLFDGTLAAGLAAVLGHVFPVWLQLKGGKGVATAIGVIFGVAPAIGLAACGVWLGVFWLGRFSSLSSLAALWAAAALGGNLLFALLALLITWTHRANIVRLRNGTEPSFRKAMP